MSLTPDISAIFLKILVTLIMKILEMKEIVRKYLWMCVYVGRLGGALFLMGWKAWVYLRWCCIGADYSAQGPDLHLLGAKTESNKAFLPWTCRNSSLKGSCALHYTAAFLLPMLSSISVLKEIIKWKQAGESKQMLPRTLHLKYMTSIPSALRLASILNPNRKLEWGRLSRFGYDAADYFVI